jgi:hypothetical protein
VRRRRLLYLALAGLAVVAVGMIVLWPSGPAAPGLTRANYNRIREGMPRAEVEQLLGPPKVDESRDPWGQRSRLDSYLCNWYCIGDAYEDDRDLEFVWAIFDQKDNVIFTKCQYREGPGVLQRLQTWARHQWHRWFPG